MQDFGDTGTWRCAAHGLEPAHLLAWTLWVMPTLRLLRFADHVGMLGAASALRQLLDGRRIAALRKQLGPELYLFGMLRAPLMGSLPAPPDMLDEPDQVGTKVRGTGIAALSAFCHARASEHPHLSARLSARLAEMAPKERAPVPAVDPPSRALLQRVLREIEPTLAGASDHVGTEA